MSSRTFVRVNPDEQPVFDLNPMEFGGFRFLGRSAIPVGRPGLKGWIEAMQIAVGANDSSPYWIGDLVAYGENRQDWADKLDQAIAMTGLKRSTLLDLGYISRHVTEEVRQISPSVYHSKKVAALPAAEQLEILTEAKENDWSVNDTGKQVKARQRRKVIQGQAVLEGQYRVIYAGPSWSQQPDLAKLPVQAHSQQNAVLFLWVPSSRLPEAFPVLEAWGFSYKSSMVWDGVIGGESAHYVRIHHELLLIATRGRCLPDVPTPMPDSVQTIRRSDVPGVRPEEFRHIITTLYTHGPYLELFGSKAIEGWSTLGNDPKQWAQQA